MGRRDGPWGPLPGKGPWSLVKAIQTAEAAKGGGNVGACPLGTSFFQASRLLSRSSAHLQPKTPFKRLQGREGMDINEDASDGKEKREGGLGRGFPIA